jgi:eukaryotic-like serine/threonine-protein kinase
MTQPNDARARGLFLAAMAVAPERRDAFLATACGGNEELRRHLEHLIHSRRVDDGSTDAFAVESPETLPSAGEGIGSPGGEDDTTREAGAGLPGAIRQVGPATLSGTRVGPYRIVREIGRGGAGTVYLAIRADQKVRQRAAIKLIQHGGESQSILNRFRHERQILASLDHPNIARFLDGGTTADGVPWLALEYVEGLPIDEYCDRHLLSTVDRLRLFRSVCSAVQHAHQNLVVHRDLKPSNILITADGTPKLLDFGIAKILNPGLSLHTVDPTIAQMMTPGYASPEQVRGETITTASDIYSLGVVLYELLTGHRPYQLSSLSPHEVARVVCEQEPVKPSTVVARTATVEPGVAPTAITPEVVGRKRSEPPAKLRRELVGDLDNIVLMALRKDPQRRYASVEQFSEDIRRHLEGRPVVARTDTFGYRAQKFVGRNKLAVAAAALLLLTLAGGVVATSWQAHVAHTERARAQQRFDDIRALGTVFLFELDREIESLPGSTRARELLVSKALETFDKLTAAAAGDRSLQRELATAYAAAGHLQWSRTYAHLGQYDGALESARKAREIRESLVAADPDDEEARRDLAYSYLVLGDLTSEPQDLLEALRFYRQSVELREALVARHPTSVNDRLALMVSYQRVGDTAGNPNFASLGDTATAAHYYDKMLRIDEDLAREFPQEPEYQLNLRIAYEKIRDVRWAMGDRDAAFEVFRQALVINENLVAEHPNNTRYRRDLLIAHRKTGLMFAEVGDLEKGVGHLQQAQRVAEEISAADPVNAGASMDLDNLAFTWYSAAMFATRQDRAALGRELAARGLALLKTLAERPETTADHLANYAFALSVFEPASLRNPSAALLSARRAADMRKEDPFVLNALAWALHANGASEQAAATAEQALARLSPGATSRKAFQADVAAFRAAVQWHAGQRTDAIAELERALGTLDVGRSPEGESQRVGRRAAARRPILESTLASYKAASR